jgi:glycerol-3-phosphate acyltransferase PlsY
MTSGLIVPLMFGFLFGSIPFGLIITRLAGKGDIRTIGSGNIGATNVLRTGSKVLAAITLLADVAKGAIPVVLAGSLATTAAVVFGDALGQGDGSGTTPAAFRAFVDRATLVAGFGAFLGHLYPPWLGFKGGKGVATYIGVLLGLFWPAAVAFCAVWLAMAFTLRFSSLSALTAAIVAPVATWALGRPDIALPMVVLSAMLMWTHRANIGRLVAGEEPRIGEKS